MTHKRRGFPILLVLLFLLAIALVVFMMFAVYSNSRVLGAPGENVKLLNNLRYSLSLYRNLELLQEPQVFPGESERKFTIYSSDSAMDVCRKLESEGYVLSAAGTCDLLSYKGSDRTLSPGTYTIPSGYNAIQLSRFIADGANRDLQFTIFAGWRLEEIAGVIDQMGFSFGTEDFVAYVHSPPPQISQPLGLPPGKSLEGYLHPGQYSLKPTLTLDEFMTEATGRTLAVIDEARQLQNQQSNAYSMDELITIASIIQRETLETAEMPTIASVFFNRLAIDMRLETDPTVQYALGYSAATQSWWKTPLLYVDLAVESDYNTYRVQGIPPGPICSPGRDAIMAAFAPDQSGYYFFRAKCDGSLTHNFAVTYEEHLANGCE